MQPIEDHSETMAGQPFELDRERAIRQILGQPEPGPFPVTLVWRDMGLILRRARVTVQNPYATITARSAG